MAAPEQSADTRRFDGPYDKRVIREGQRRIVRDVVEADLGRRVPGAEDDPRCVQIEPLEGDVGYRYEFRYRPENPPITFDAGSAGLWVNPGGFAILLSYERDDPTYGINLAVYGPDGGYLGGGDRLDGFNAFDMAEGLLP